MVFKKENRRLFSHQRGRVAKFSPREALDIRKSVG
jgi:hypothetical protein